MTTKIRTYIFSVVVMAALTARPGPANAQAGSLDKTFGTAGVVTQKVAIFPQSATLDAAGNIVIVGTNGVSQPGNIARFLANGKFDSSFGNGGLVTTAALLQLNTVAVQRDGKIVVGGYTDLLSQPHQQLAVARFNADGTPDATFGNNGLVTTQVDDSDSQVQVILVQSDGKILAGVNSDNGGLIRYTADGALDGSFGSGGFADPEDSATLIALQSDGTILITSGFAVHEVSADGIVEPSVNVGTIVAVATRGASTFQRNGEVVAAQGIFEGRNARAVQVQRFEFDGNIDPTFNSPVFQFQKEPPGTADFSSLQSLVIQANGKVVGGGNSTTPTNNEFALARFNTNGAFDRTFGNKGEVLTKILDTSAITVLLTQSSGKIVAIGTASKGNTSFVALARYLIK